MVGCTEVAAAYRAANAELRLGGDWFDLIDRDDHRVVAVVGDVVGHGLEQIGCMGQLRTALDVLSRSVRSPEEIMRLVDDFAVDVPGGADVDGCGADARWFASCEVVARWSYAAAPRSRRRRAPPLAIDPHSASAGQ